MNGATCATLEVCRSPASGRALERGTVVGGARIEALRFEGGFAEIYEANLDGRRVAVKRLRPDVIAVPSAAERLRLEAKALAEIDHPGVVGVIDCGEHRGWPYLLLEWLDGPTLAEVVARGALSPTTALSVLEQVGAALSAVHARGVIHRDIKAENVIVVDSRAMRVKLVDFGIAKLLRGGYGGSLTTTMQLLGTPVAMAPEQILGGTIDERTDVYALGVLACHLLTGRLPFLGRTSIETQELHLSADPPCPSELVAIPAAVDAVVRRAMAKAASARHPSVQVFTDDLRDALAGGTAPRRGAALYIEIETDGDDDDDLDALEGILAEAATTARAAGLDIIVDAGNAMLAAASLPGDGLELRRAAIDAALALTRPHMRVRVRARVRALRESVAAGIDIDSFPRAASGVVATADALAGLVGLAVEQLDEAFVRVSR